VKDDLANLPEMRDSSLIATGSKRKGNTNPKRQRGMPQVSCGTTPAPSLALRIGIWGDLRRGPGSARAEFPGGVQRGVSKFPRGEPSSWSDAGAAPGISDTWTHQRAWSHRGRRIWRMITRVSRELGRPCCLHRDWPLNRRMTPSRGRTGSTY
jgi:hypothetical protein